MNLLSSIKNLLFKRWKKKRLLYHTFDYMLEGIQIHDFNWRYIYVNNALVNYSQYSKDELLGSTLMDKYPGIEKSDLFIVFERCMRERVSEYLETEFTFPDGSKLDFELSIQPIPEGLFILSINITDRKRAEEKQKTSENYYHSIFEQANDTIYIVDPSPKPKFIDINQSGCELLGYTKDELLQLTIFDIIFENDFPDSTEKIKDLNIGKPIRKERKLKRKDGSAVETELSAKKMEDGNIMVVVRDISEQKKILEQLDINEKRFRALVENNQDIISLIDASFSIIYCSPSVTRIMGYGQEDIKALEGPESIHPEDRVYVADIMRKVKENPGNPIHATFRRQHQKGHYIWLEGAITNLLHDNLIKAYVTNFRDISDRKNAEELLQRNEIRFRTLIENNNDMISLMDASFKVIYRSPSASKILGWTDEDMKGIDGANKIHPEDKGLSKKIIEDLFKEPGKIFHATFRSQHKNGHYLWLEGTVINLLDNENLNAIVFNYRDVTERKTAEEEVRKLNENLEMKVVERTSELEKIIIALKESEEKFQKIFQASAAGISITRLSDSTYTDVNTAFEEITGFSKEEIMGHSSQELGMIANFEKRDKLLKEIKERGSAKNYEIDIRIKSGTVLSVLTALETIYLKGEKYVISIIYDITERKKMEEQLILANKELESFSYSVSHDLRAPLRAINGYSQMLIKQYISQFDGEGNRLMQNITDNAKKMEILIDDLLALSQLGKKEVEKKHIDLNELLKEVITELNKTMKHEARIKTGKLHHVKADYRLLYQVIFNLLSNAIKYSSKKEDPLIEVSSKEQNGEVIVSVKDNGAGFEMKYASRLFDVFQRFHSQEEFDGTGVGLAIVQRIIEKHNGRVWAEGKLNEGATFNFSLTTT